MIYERFPKKSNSILKSYLSYIRDKEKINYTESIDFKKEINIIPIEDSLYFSDSKSKRSFIIDILKKDFIGHIRGLQKAIENEDSETSHYAATALMEIKKQFELMIQEAKENYEKNKQDLNIIQEYVNILKKYLNSSLPDKIDYREYLKKYSDILKKLLSKYKTNKVYFYDKISCDIELGNYDCAKKICKEFFHCFPDSEEPYLILMKLYYSSHNYINFIKILNNFKKANLNFSNKAKDITEYWEKLI